MIHLHELSPIVAEPPPAPMSFSVLVSIAVFAGAWLSLAIVWVL